MAAAAPMRILAMLAFCVGLALGQGIPSAQECISRAASIGENNLLQSLASCTSNPPSAACCSAANALLGFPGSGQLAGCLCNAEALEQTLSTIDNNNLARLAGVNRAGVQTTLNSCNVPNVNGGGCPAAGGTTTTSSTPAPAPAATTGGATGAQAGAGGAGASAGIGGLTAGAGIGAGGLLGGVGGGNALGAIHGAKTGAVTGAVAGATAGAVAGAAAGAGGAGGAGGLAGAGASALAGAGAGAGGIGSGALLANRPILNAVVNHHRDKFGHGHHGVIGRK